MVWEPQHYVTLYNDIYYEY